MTKTYKSLYLLVILTIASQIKADFIIPFNNPYYDYLELLQTTGKAKLTTIEPVYTNSQLKELDKIQTSDSKYYKQKLYPLILKNGLRTPLSSFKTSYKSAKNILTLKNNFNENLINYKDSSQQIIVNGILGYQYDLKKGNSLDQNRKREYWGVELKGNLYPNFGFFVGLNKGHYNGDEEFINEDPFLSRMQGGSYDGLYEDDGDYYKVDLVSETDFKNKYVNISLGYGQLKIGESLTNSIILDNQNVISYGYLKYYKQVKNFYYTALWMNLNPDSLAGYNDNDETYKSMALHTLTYRNDLGNFILGAGNLILYSDTPLDFGYITPFALYKVMDNKNHGRDNVIFFTYLEHRPFAGFRYYFNYTADDIRYDRWTKSETFFSQQAFQTGFWVAPFNEDIPLLFGAESTIIGSGMYNHKTEILAYKHDGRRLGFPYGSNLMSNTIALHYIKAKYSVKLSYQNWLCDVNNQTGEKELLAGNLERNQIIDFQTECYLIPKFKIYFNYKHSISDKSNNYYLSGIEFEF